ncbi:MAG: choice-of-anchor I family protein [Planctomycetota bacterium]
MRGSALTIAGLACAAVSAGAQIALEPIGRYDTGITLKSAAEILAYDASTRRLFVTNAANNAIDALSIADPTSPALAFSIDLSPFGGGVNSVAVKSGMVAVAVEAEVKQEPGAVVFFDLEGNHLHHVEVGALPDSLEFSPDGRFLLTANEGEPNDAYTIDPPGSVSVIAIPANRSELRFARVRTATFDRFNLLGVPAGVRIFGPGATPSQDLEPEYIAFSADSSTAYVVCQENNAFAIVDVGTAQITSLVPLGTKDHSMRRNAMDASDRDGNFSISNRPVRGFYQPDTIASYDVDGRTFIVTANEGDTRDYPGFSEVARVSELEFDREGRLNWIVLKSPDQMGRLKVSRVHGDTDGDGDHDEIYSFGGRSIAIWDDEGNLVWDSGSDLEALVARAVFDTMPFELMNPRFDSRSDDRGPEPEALAIGVLAGRTYAFCGLERTSGIAIFDITDPFAPAAVGYDLGNAYPGGEPGDPGIDIAPESLVFINADASPTGEPLLAAAYEVSGSTVIYRLLTDTPP